MYGKFISFLAVILFAGVAQAGIINTLPPVPKKVEKDKLNARLAASVDWQQGNTNKLDLNAGGFMTWLRDPWTIHFVSSFTRATSFGALEDFNTLNHLRGRYFFNEWFGAEAYTQHEYDPFRKLDTRYLLGGGPFVKVSELGALSFIIGTSGMFEYIKPDDQQPEEFNPRWSSYLQAEIRVNKNFAIQDTFFFQTRFNDLSDVMVFNTAALEIKALDWFGVTLGFTVSHDERPLAGVEKTDLSLTSSLFIEYQ